MRRDSFIEGKRRRVARPRNHAHDKRADRAAPAGNFIGMFEQIDKDSHKSRSRQTGGENTRGNDDAQNVAVAFAHADEELLGEFLRIGKRDGKRIDGTDQHGLSYAHFDGGKPQIARHKQSDRNERRNCFENVAAPDIVGNGSLCFFGPSFLIVAQRKADNRDAD